MCGTGWVHTVPFHVATWSARGRWGLADTGLRAPAGAGPGAGVMLLLIALAHSRMLHAGGNLLARPAGGGPVDIAVQWLLTSVVDGRAAPCSDSCSATASCR